MPQEPDDDLGRLFAEEEAAIGDDGFSQRVVEQARPASPWRSTAIYGAGIAGFGFAVGGISQLTPHLQVTQWMDRLTGAVTSASAGGALQNPSDATQLAIVAVLAGITFLVAAVAAQSR